LERASISQLIRLSLLYLFKADFIMLLRREVQLFIDVIVVLMGLALSGIIIAANNQLITLRGVLQLLLKTQ
jgi:hypothetical protein